MNLVSRVFIIGVAGIFLCFILLAISIVKASKKQEKLPIIPTQASVISKRIEITYGGTERSMMFARSEYKWYYVTFALQDESSIELSVSELDYDKINENDRGTLFVCGKTFVEFVKQS